MRSGKTRQGRVFDVLVVAFMLVVVFATLYPFWNLGVISVNDPQDGMRGGLTFWPRVFSLASYERIFSEDSDIFSAMGVSLRRTALGTALNVSVTAWVAYTLSQRKFILRNFLAKYLVATMYLSAGLIPVYLLYNKLGLLNRFDVYIVPHLLSVYNVILVHTYIGGLPASLTEAAQIDGAGEVRVFFQVILPLIVPVLATITLFISVWQWSQWQDTYFFASRNPALSTLQFEMMKIVTQSSGRLTEQQIRDAAARPKVTSQSLQAAMVMVATVPILTVYPFVQRYFIKGMTLGSVKE